MSGIFTPVDGKLMEEKAWIEIASIQERIHPVTRERFNITQEDFESWSRQFSLYQGTGNIIPVVDGHGKSATGKLGHVTGVRVVGDSFQVQVAWNEVAKEKAASVTYSSVSPWINRDQLIGDTTFPSAIMHIGVTDYPVLRGLKVFSDDFYFSLTDPLVLSIIGGKGGKPKMELTTLGLLLGIDEPTDEKVIAAIKKLQNTPPQVVNTASTAFSSFFDTLKKAGFIDEKKSVVLSFVNDADILDAKLSTPDKAKSFGEALALSLTKESKLKEEQFSFDDGNVGSGEGKPLSLEDTVRKLYPQTK